MFLIYNTEMDFFSSTSEVIFVWRTDVPLKIELTDYAIALSNKSLAISNHGRRYFDVKQFLFTLYLRFRSLLNLICLAMLRDISVVTCFYQKKNFNINTFCNCYKSYQQFVVSPSEIVYLSTAVLTKSTTSNFCFKVVFNQKNCSIRFLHIFLTRLGKVSNWLENISFYSIFLFLNLCYLSKF